MTTDEMIDELLDTPRLGSITRHAIIAKLRAAEELLKQIKHISPSKTPDHVWHAALEYDNARKDNK